MNALKNALAARLTTSRFKTLSLKNLVMVTSALLVLFVTAITGYLNDRAHVTSVQTAVETLAAQSSKQVTERLQGYIKGIEQTAVFTAETLKTERLDISQPDALSTLLMRTSRAFDSIDYTHIATVNGGFLSLGKAEDGSYRRLQTHQDSPGALNSYLTDPVGYTRQLLKSRPYFDPRQSPAFKEAQQRLKPQWSQVYPGPIETVLGISYLFPITDNQQRLTSILGFDLILSNLSDYLSQVEVTDNATLLIIEKTGLLIASSDNSDTVFKFDHINSEYNRQNIKTFLSDIQHHDLDRFINHLKPDSQTLIYDDELVHLSQISLTPETDWLLVIKIPNQDFMADINLSRFQAQMWSLAAAFISMFIALIVMRYRMRPLQQLTDTAQKISRGETGIQTPVVRNDELGELARTFNTMSQNLEQLFSNLESHVETRTEQLHKANKELKYQAEHDLLTGAYNRRSFLTRTNHQLSHLSFGAICLIDIDHFKTVNDRFGHFAGDQALKSLSSTILSMLRDGDLFARYGGEEFAVFLSHTQINAARCAAERIRDTVSEMIIESEGKRFRFTVSIGVALYNQDENTTLELLLQKADSALYHAKNSGRNRTVIWDEFSDFSDEKQADPILSTE